MHLFKFYAVRQAKGHMVVTFSVGMKQITHFELTDSEWEAFKGLLSPEKRSILGGIIVMEGH